MRQFVFLFIAILGMGFWSCSDDQMEERFISDTQVTSENPVTKSAQEGLNVKTITFNVRSSSDRRHTRSFSTVICFISSNTFSIRAPA